MLSGRGGSGALRRHNLKADSVFYRLFQRLPGLVFELAGWPTPDLTGYRWRFVRC